MNAMSSMSVLPFLQSICVCSLLFNVLTEKSGAEKSCVLFGPLHAGISAIPRLIFTIEIRIHLVQTRPDTMQKRHLVRKTVENG